MSLNKETKPRMKCESGRQFGKQVLFGNECFDILKKNTHKLKHYFPSILWVGLFTDNFVENSVHAMYPGYDNKLHLMLATS